MYEEQVDTTYRCSFCGKAREQVEHIIQGPGRVTICDWCVGLCNALLAERRTGRRLRKRRRRPSGSLRRRKATVVVGSDEAVARVREEYESIASLSRLPLSALNRSPDPAEHYTRCTSTRASSGHVQTRSHHSRSARA